MNKTLKIMTSAAMLAGVVAPVAVTSVSANSKNVVSKVPSIADDYDWADLPSGSAPTTSIYVYEDSVTFTSGDTFRLSLPSGAKWVKSQYAKGLLTGTATKGYEVVSVTDRDLELKILGSGHVKNDVASEIPVYLEVDGAEGEIKLTVDGKDSTVSSGQYTIAYVGDGDTVTTIADVETIGDGDAIETIRIDETSLNAIYDAKYNSLATAQEITFKLPSKFEWKTTTPTVTPGGGFSAAAVGFDSDVTFDDNEVTIKVWFTGTAPTSIGTIYIEGLEIDADNDAPYGEIEVDVDGDEVTSETLVVANYGDYGTTASLEGDVPTLIAGRNNEDIDDLETVEFTIEETTPGSWLPGRSVTMELPSWVKVVGYEVTDSDNVSGILSDLGKNLGEAIEGDDNIVEFDLPDFTPANTEKSLTVKLYVSTKANASGDVTLKVDGRAGITVPETVIAKVVTPVSIEVEKADVRTGIKAQPVGDIIITENVAGAITEDASGKLVKVWLPENVEFTSEPTIEVLEGNLEIDESSINLVDGDSAIEFEIDSESSRASKIKISGLKLDLDRTVAEGDIPVKIGGSALVKNNALVSGDVTDDAFGSADYSIGDKKYSAGTPDEAGETELLDGKINVGEFDQSSVATATIATVVTPAEGNVSAETVTLKIGEGSMTVGDKTVELDAAPFIEASTGRTYLPLRAIANAIGASAVEWDNASRTATVVKDGLVAQMTIGQNAYLLNGAKIGMDGKAQIVKERTFLPIRALGNALGATVEWDAATQTVTIK